MAIGGGIRDGKNKEDALRRVEWIHARQSLGATDQPETAAQPLLPHGDLKTPSTSQVILDAVGTSLLSDIVGDLLDLLETSCAVHERNGDYALGLFAAGWCRLLASTSRRGCDLPGDREDLRAGQGHCHESCWSEASRCSMETGMPVDMDCPGGIRLFAVPIRAGKEIVGSISVGYGDPPRDPEELKELAVTHKVGVDELRERAEACDARPAFVTGLAKKRVLFSARLIGELVERKQTEQALRDSEEKYSAAVRQAKDGVIIIQDDTLQFVNAAMADILGYTAAEMENKPFVDYLAPENRALVAAKVKARLAGEDVPRVYETGLLHKNGTVVEVELSASAIRYRGKPADAVIIRDITERKRAEEALRTSESFLSGIINQSPYPMWIADAQGTLVRLNQACRDLIQISDEEVVGKYNIFQDSVVEEQGLLPLVRRVFEEGETVRFEIKYDSSRLKSIQLKHSAFVILDSTLFPIRDASGRLTNAVIQHMDITERKRAEAALAESERRFSVFMDHLPACVFIKDQTGRLLFANRYVKEIFDWQECVGKTTVELLPQEVAELMAADDRKVLKEGPFVIQERVTDTRGLERFFETYKFPLADEDELVMLGGISVDITERKRAEEALRQSEAAYRLLFEQSIDGIIITAQRKILEANSAFCALHGFPLDRVIGMNPFDLIHPEDRDAAIQRAQALQSGTQFFESYVYRSPRHGDSSLWIEVRSKLIKWGGQPAIQSIVRDITERKRAEKALQESNETLRALIQASPVAIVAFGTEGEVRLWNPAAERMLGWSEEEVLGQFLPHVSEERLEEHRALRERVLRGEILTGVEIRRRKKDGSPIDMSISAAPLHDAQGVVTGIMSVHIDVTERKRVEEERAKLEGQMREVQKLESLGVLAGGIAHDFNNLLMAILGNADLALLRLSPASPARHNVEEIARASQRAAELCRQMLAYSGKGRFVVGRYDLSEIVREMTQMLEISVSKKASLRYSFAEDLPAVEVDATQMRQVVMNLITNASEAVGDTSGVIRVSIGVMECDRAYLSESYLDDGLPESRYVYLEVSDTGCGMDRETVSRIFDPFFTTKFMGRGLGLAAVLGIVRGHKGAIKVYSEPGKGTTFRILLPAVEWPADEGAQSIESGSSSLGGGWVLLVDDDPDVRCVGSEMLELLGFQVLIAIDGQDALEVFRARGEIIDCIILDLTMPRMGGEEAFRELRRLRSDVRVILSSGYNEQEVTQRFVGEGLSGFIQKPYTVAKLLETLGSVLG